VSKFCQEHGAVAASQVLAKRIAARKAKDAERRAKDAFGEAHCARIALMQSAMQSPASGKPPSSPDFGAVAASQVLAKRIAARKAKDAERRAKDAFGEAHCARIALMQSAMQSPASGKPPSSPDVVVWL
jgi:hypothetical protein